MQYYNIFASYFSLSLSVSLFLDGRSRRKDAVAASGKFKKCQRCRRWRQRNNKKQTFYQSWLWHIGPRQTEREKEWESRISARGI